MSVLTEVHTLGRSVTRCIVIGRLAVCEDGGGHAGRPLKLTAKQQIETTQYNQLIRQEDEQTEDPSSWSSSDVNRF